MIEIIPNWHPLLVHFTVGLLSTSVLFYLASACLSRQNPWKQQWLNMANWSLWSGCLFAIGTAIAGWLAYNSVAHDSASHAAMTLHRNWALPTASTFLLLGLWAIFIARKESRPGFLFLTFSAIAAGLLMVTGWLGSEAVYRYGLGVKSLPVVKEGADGHNHSHGSEHGESGMEGEVKDEHQHSMEKIEQQSTKEGHQHSHENKEHMTKPEQALLPDGHQHEHKSKNSLSTIEQANTLTEHTHKTVTDNIIEPTIQSSGIEPHVHNSQSAEPIANSLDQDNASEEMHLTPSELHYLYHANEQNEETQYEEDHYHDHEH